MGSQHSLQWTVEGLVLHRRSRKRNAPQMEKVIPRMNYFLARSTLFSPLYLAMEKYFRICALINFDFALFIEKEMQKQILVINSKIISDQTKCIHGVEGHFDLIRSFACSYNDHYIKQHYQSVHSLKQKILIVCQQEVPFKKHLLDLFILLSSISSTQRTR